MPWEIPIYICSRFAEALEQIYIPVWLFKPPSPLRLEKEICALCMGIIHVWILYYIHVWIRQDIMYTYGYRVCYIHIWILY